MDSERLFVLGYNLEVNLPGFVYGVWRKQMAGGGGRNSGWCVVDSARAAHMPHHQMGAPVTS